MDYTYLKENIEYADPFKRNPDGSFVNRIATVFLSGRKPFARSGSLPHACYKLFTIKHLNRLRGESDLPTLTDTEENDILSQTVDLILVGRKVLIRPEPQKMDLAFRADLFIQDSGIMKFNIAFIIVDEQVRQAVRRRGECYRLQNIPKANDEIVDYIEKSKMSIDSAVQYFYSHQTGIKYLTCHRFTLLESLPEDELRKCLLEIQGFSNLKNKHNNPEIAFFMVRDFGSFNFSEFNFHDSSEKQLRTNYNTLKRTFSNATPNDFRDDNFEQPVWVAMMFRSLVHGLKGEEEHLEEMHLGLAREFRSRITFLPCGSLDGGNLSVDPVLDIIQNIDDETAQRLYDPRVIGICKNFQEAYRDLEYINIGKVENTLSGRRAKNIVMPGRRAVYVATFENKNGEDFVRFVRWQKRDTAFFLNSGLELEEAVREAQRYRNDVLIRYDACRTLGLNLLPVTVRDLVETYQGENKKYHGTGITTSYFERDYAFGFATDKIPERLYLKEKFVTAFGRLLGNAAAPNMILGRYHEGVLFDDGDEIVLMDGSDMPVEIVVSDVTASFRECEMTLSEFAPDYIQPVLSRAELVPDFIDDFKGAYIDSLVNRFRNIQLGYQKNREEYNNMFNREGISKRFINNWKMILHRLDETDIDELGAILCRIKE